MTLYERIKQYENAVDPYLTRRVPVMMRFDGRAFKTYTKGFKKPFDEILNRCMRNTMLNLCKSIQGCKIGYTQSDEITVLLTDYDTLETQGWYDYEKRKIETNGTSIVVKSFNYFMLQEFLNLEKQMKKDMKDGGVSAEDMKYLKMLKKKTELEGLADFDGRAFNMPKEEVCNAFLQRQQDASRNSIQSLGRAYFSQKDIKGMSNNMLQDKLFTEKGVNWNDCPTVQKRGCCAIKVPTKVGNGVIRNKWTLDMDIPIFSADRDYIDKYVFLKDDKE